MKPKLLWCSEASYLSTGYAVYSREVLNRLHASNKLDITEFGAYGSNEDPRSVTIPWKFIGNLPQRGNKQEEDAYNSNPVNMFGTWKFEHVCLHVKPNIVFDNRDFWMAANICNSPFRDKFHWSWMVTCDAQPQAREWIDAYSNCDSVFTYSDWAIDVLKSQSGNKIPLVTSTPGGAGPEFVPQDKSEIKKKSGLDKFKIIGFVARNQRRKLFSDLFDSFRKFLDKTGRTDVLLYLHTSYPDKNPWNIPELLNEYGIASKVLMTYRCNDSGNNNGCGLTFPAFFSDYGVVCKRCKKIASTAGVQNGADNNFLAQIYNLFDVYVQYANCLAKGTEVLLSRGWTKIEDVKVGDFAWTHQGRYMPVKQTFVRQPNNNVYDINLWSDFESLTITNEHPVYGLSQINFPDRGQSRSFRGWLGEKLSRINQLPEPAFTKVKDLKEGDLIAYKIDDAVADIEKIDLAEFADEKDLILKDSIKIKYGHTYNRFIEVDNDFLKFVGLFAADGRSSKEGIQISCHINDIANQNLAQSVIEKLTGKSAYLKYYKDRNGVEVYGFCKLLAKAFKRWSSKLQNKSLPYWTEYLPIKKQKLIIQGLFLGDGCSYFRRRKYTSSYSTISKKLASQLRELLRRSRINFNLNIRDRKNESDGKNRKPAYIFEINGNIKQGSFETKQNNTRNFYYKQYHYLQIKTIEKSLYNNEVYNFEVEADNSYMSRCGLMHNSEGLGIPQLEAAACGTPVMSVDYSAMSDVVRKVNGYPLKLKTLYREIETGCNRAIPDNDYLVEKLIEFFNMPEAMRTRKGWETRQGYEKYYGYDKAAQSFLNYFLSLNAEELESRWKRPARLHTPATQPPQNCSNSDFCRWLICDVLGEPERIGSYMHSRLIKDLNYGCTLGGIGGMYFNENSMIDFSQQTMFDREKAYDHFRSLCERRNQYERLRCQ